MTKNSFSDPLLNWFDRHGRKDLPWQKNASPYHVWLSEIMLQQTQVKTVIPYYQRFIKHYGDVQSLADAPIDNVLALWTGLGYYARARNMHKAAILMCDQHQGSMPNELQALIDLPGIGRSTAGAIMALAYQQRFAILDGNVRRVLTRFYAISGWPGNKVVENQLWQYAEKLLPVERIADYIQAQMDLGATICTRTKPTCEQCPLTTDCKAFLLNNAQNYPTTKPKKIIPLRQTNWLIAQLQTGEVLLQQRPNSGIWGGLWSFPELSFTKNIATTCQHEFNINTGEITIYPHFRHVFSHFKLDIYPYLVSSTIDENHIAENKKLTWYKISDALQLGLPAPVKSFLQSLQ